MNDFYTDEGNLKFNCHRIDKEIEMGDKNYKDLFIWREKLYQLKLIGAYPNGIGFGNISVKAQNKHFIISGTGTGNLPDLKKQHFTQVTSWSFSSNSLECIGKINASAESLSHAVFYEFLPEVGAVIHIHNLKMWEKGLYKFPTTSEKIEYGTPEMAGEIQKILSGIGPDEEKILVMGGHKEGLFFWGESLDEAGKTVISCYNSFGC